MSPLYQPLPRPPAPVADQTVVQRGLAILAYVIEYGITCTIAIVDLEYADHAGVFASAAPGCLVTTYDRISDARHRIRRALAAVAELDARATLPGGTAPHAPNVGPMAPLRPRPDTRPPAPEYALPGSVPRDNIRF